MQTDLSNNRMHMACKEWVAFRGGNCFIPFLFAFKWDIDSYKKKIAPLGAFFVPLIIDPILKGLCHP